GQDDTGKLILRVTLGILILFHGVSKIVGGIGFVSGALTKMGMPAGIGYLVYVGEVVAPLMLIIGVWTRPAALVIAINMVVAVLLAHTSQLFTMSKSGGYALELQAMYLFTAIAIAFLGAGRYSVAGINGRWN
ncbi:MAG: DoxX family protein, partial [Caldimonas sp.]